MRGPRFLGSLAGGSAAGAVSLAFLWAAGQAASTIPFPPFSLAARIIRITPGGVTTFLIESLQHNAIRLLAAVVTVSFLLIAGCLPLLLNRARRSGPWAAALAFAGVLTVAVLADPIEHGPVAAVMCLAAGVIYGFTAQWLAQTDPLASSGPLVSRRETFSWMAMTTGALLLGGTGLRALLGRRGEASTNVRLAPVDEVARAPHRGPFPSVPGLSPEVTPAARHYVVDIDLVDPVVQADSWTLKVDGAVRRPQTHTFNELQSTFSVVEEHSVLTCISNEVGGPLIGNSKWAGVRLRDVLQHAGVATGATNVVFDCADGYTASIPLSRALEPSALLAVAQDGRPLRPEHGFPCRMRVPALYGMLNAKWLEHIHVVRSPQPGYWAQRGWSTTAVVRTESRIDTRDAVRAGEAAWLGGVAWAGDRGISRVQVTLDGGRVWQDALLHPALSRCAWVQWAFRWTPARRGDYRVACRATDGQGAAQDERDRPPHPTGATGYHEIAIVAL